MTPSWQLADKTTTNSTTPPPAGQPVLTADDYGFHQGDVWYRGTYSGAGTATTVQTALRRRWGRDAAGVARRGLPRPERPGQRRVLATRRPGRSPSRSRPGLQTNGTHTLAVMVRNDGHNEDGGVNDAQKEGRGLISVQMQDATDASVNPQISVAHPGRPRRREHRRPRPRHPERRRAVRRAPRLVPAGLSRRRLDDHDRPGEHGHVRHGLVPHDV